MQNQLNNQIKLNQSIFNTRSNDDRQEHFLDQELKKFSDAVNNFAFLRTISNLTSTTDEITADSVDNKNALNLRSLLEHLPTNKSSLGSARSSVVQQRSNCDFDSASIDEAILQAELAIKQSDQFLRSPSRSPKEPRSRFRSELYLSPEALGYSRTPDDLSQLRKPSTFSNSSTRVARSLDLRSPAKFSRS